MLDASNDDSTGAGGTSPYDGYGHAAYLLVESLLHELIANAALTTDSAIEIVEMAAETGVAQLRDQVGRPPQRASEILLTLAASLRADMQGRDLI